MVSETIITILFRGVHYKMTKKKKNYINNKTLYTAMIEHRSKILEADRKGAQRPVASNYIGQCILLICNNLAVKPNFSGYSYKQEMISDAIGDCVAAIDKFNPDKTNNPFAYFTQIAWNAFLRRLTKEKKQAYIKHKNYENSFLMNELWENSQNMHLKSNDYSADLVKSFEEKLTKPKKIDKIKGVEKFLETPEVEDHEGVIEDA